MTVCKLPGTFTLLAVLRPVYPCSNILPSFPALLYILPVVFDHLQYARNVVSNQKLETETPGNPIQPNITHLIKSFQICAATKKKKAKKNKLGL